MKNRTIGWTIFFVILIIFAIVITNNMKKNKNIISISIDRSDIVFNFSKKDLLVFSYEISSLNEKKENSFENKKVLSEVLEKNTNKIVVRDFNGKNIKKNQPYYFSISREGFTNEAGVALQSINFCIKNDNSIYTENNEETFIRNCIN